MILSIFTTSVNSITVYDEYIEAEVSEPLLRHISSLKVTYNTLKNTATQHSEKTNQFSERSTLSYQAKQYIIFVIDTIS